VLLSEKNGIAMIYDQLSFLPLARALSDEELEEICRSQDRPEKERLILRKRHQYPTHEEFKRKGTITQKRNQIQKMYEETVVPWAPAMGPSGTPSPIGAYASLQPLHHGLPDRQQTVDIITSIGNGIAKSTPPVSGKPSSDPSTTSYFPSSERSNEPTAVPATQQSSNWDQKAPTTPQSGGTSVSSRFSVASFNSSHAAYRSQTPKLRQFFGERPPSEVISSNLHSFFPNHKPEILETAGFNAKRMSMRRASQSSGMSTSRHRDSVMPELASVLGLELDKVFEQEELEALQAQAGEEEENFEVEEEEEFRPPAELKLPTSFPQKTSLQNKRYSTLLTIKSDGDVESHMPARKSSLINTDTTLADKAAQHAKVATSPPVSASTTLLGTPMDAPEVVEIPSPEPSPTEPSPTEPVIHGK
jgi:Ras-binding domain of Byr2